jgi:hypothetical protein
VQSRGSSDGDCAAAIPERGNGRSKSRRLTSVDFIIDVARGYARDRVDPPKVHDRRVARAAVPSFPELSRGPRGPRWNVQWNMYRLRMHAD